MVQRVSGFARIAGLLVAVVLGLASPSARAEDPRVPPIGWDFGVDSRVRRNLPRTLEAVVAGASAVPDDILPMYLVHGIAGVAGQVPRPCFTSVELELGDGGVLWWRDLPNFATCPGVLPDAAFYEPDALDAFQRLDGPARTAAVIARLSGPDAYFAPSGENLGKIAWNDLLAFEWLMRRARALATDDPTRAAIAALEPRLASILAVRTRWVEETIFRRMADGALAYSPGQIVRTWQLWTTTLGRGGACRGALSAAFPGYSEIPDPASRATALAACPGLRDEEPLIDAAARFAVGQMRAATQDPLTLQYFALNEAIVKRVNLQLPALRAQCHPAVSGEWALDFLVGVLGEAKGARTAATANEADAAFQACVEGVLNTWTFDPVTAFVPITTLIPAAHPVPVSLRLTFEAVLPRP